MYRPPPPPFRVRDPPPSRVPPARRYCGLIGFSGAQSGPPSLTRKGPPPLRVRDPPPLRVRDPPYDPSGFDLLYGKPTGFAGARSGPPSPTRKGPPGSGSIRKKKLTKKSRRVWGNGSKWVRTPYSWGKMGRGVKIGGSRGPKWRLEIGRAHV